MPILVNNSVTSRYAVVLWWPCLVLAPQLTSARSLFIHFIDSPMNACYHSVQNLQSYTLLSKYTKIKIYRTVILLVVLYGCETWSLTLREERRLRVLKRIFGPKRDEVTGE